MATAVGVGIFVVEVLVVTLLVAPNITCLNQVCSFSLSTLAKLATELQRRSSDPSVVFSANGHIFYVKNKIDIFFFIYVELIYIYLPVLNNVLKKCKMCVLNCSEA